MIVTVAVLNRICMSALSDAWVILYSELTKNLYLYYSITISYPM
jgi:hypothetical protein